MLGGAGGALTPAQGAALLRAGAGTPAGVAVARGPARVEAAT